MRKKNLTNRVVVLPVATVILLAICFLPLAYSERAVGKIVTGKLDPSVTESLLQSERLRTDRAIEATRQKGATQRTKLLAQATSDINYTQSQFIDLVKQVNAQETRIKALEKKVEKLEMSFTKTKGTQILRSHQPISQDETEITQLRIGMTKQEVLKIYGKPKSTDSSKVVGSDILTTWWYEEPVRYVRFYNDTVNDWHGF